MAKSSNQGRCPKCGGNLYLDKDHYGWYEQCLQCSFTRDLRIVYKEDGKEAVFAELEKLDFNGNNDQLGISDADI